MNIFRVRALMRRHGLAASLAAIAGLSLGAPALAQDVYDEHYEWEADEGVHEEEWYDPSDWWDDDSYERQVDYESDWYETGWGDDTYDYGWGEAYDAEPDWDDVEYYDAEPDEDDMFGYGMYRYDYGFDDEYEPAVEPYERGYDDAYGWDWETDRYDPTQTANYDDYWGPDDWDSPYEYRTVRGVLHQDADRERSQPRNQRADRRQMRNVQLRGEIEDWKRVQIRGQRDAHTLVRLELEDGEDAIVNLGPNVSLSRLNLEEDDDVVVMGPMGQINGRDVVMARGLRIEGRTIRMNNWSSNQRMQREQQRRDMQRQQTPQDRTAELRGELTSWSRVTLDGHRDSHTLVKMKLDDGREAIVDLGPNVSVSRLNLSEGDRVAVFGPVGTINNRDVVMAMKIRADGQTISMNNWSPDSHQRDARQSRSSSGQQGDQRMASQQRRSDERRVSEQYALYSTQQASDRQRSNQEQATSQRDSRQQARDRNQRRVVQRVISDWPEQSKKSARAMLEKYGLPAGVTPEMMIWRDTGPFVKTIVYANPVQHDFPVPHKDVLEQFVNFEVPADRMDELAKFDGSIIVFRTDGLMSARCHKEAMNVLALNLATEVAEGVKTVEEARRKYAQVAQAYMQGDRPKITQRLAFNSKPDNTDRHNWSDQRFERQRTTMK